MTFANRTFNETISTLLTSFASASTDVTDLREGSVIATILESVAVVSQQIEEDMAARLDADIATSAYRSFNFSLIPEQAATGSLDVFATDTVHGPITIPVGTAFVVPGTNLRFLSQSQIILQPNAASVSVYVVAETAGTISNVPAGSVTRLQSSISGISGSNNAFPFINGKDPETDVERRLRFQHAIAKLHYGTNGAVEAGISEVQTLNTFGVPQERVGRVRVDETDAKLVAYITNDTVLGPNSPTFPYAASADLCSAVQLALDGSTQNGVKIPGYKAAGIRTQTIAATIHPVAVSLNIRPSAGYSMNIISPTVANIVQGFFNRLNIGDSLSLQALKRTIGSVRGIDDFVMQLPSVNIVSQPSEILALIPFTDVSANPPIAPDMTQSWIQRF